MRIFAAQLKSHKGNIQANILKHLELVEAAAGHNADLVFFPELSLTGYEPQLAKDLAMFIDDQRLDIFQQKSDAYEMVIGLGIPTKSSDGPKISLAIFQPQKPPLCYSKQTLHADEYPFFVVGNKQLYLSLDGLNIAPAICYESMLMPHADEVCSKGVSLYLASVAKHQEGVQRGSQHYAAVAAKHNMPVMMANAHGPSDNFVSYGCSAVWDNTGRRCAVLSNDKDGLVGMDLDSQKSFTLEL